MKLTRCRLTVKTQLKLLEYFVLEVTARSAADVLELQPNTTALFYKKLRLIIAYHLALEEHQVFAGQIELDESYFGGVRKGKRGRGAAGKIAVFGILKRGGKVYTKVVADTKSSTLMPLIVNKIAPDSIVYTDSYRSYNALDVSDFEHHRINHSKEFGIGKNHINGIENFWNQASVCSENTMELFLKPSPYFLKSVSLDLTTEPLKNSLKRLSFGVASEL